MTITFKAALCPSCGGVLQLPENKKIVSCIYCKSDILVQDAIRSAAATPSVDNLLTLAESARDGGNWQQAYHYYCRVLEIDIADPRAWLGKALSIGMLASPANPVLAEMTEGLRRAQGTEPVKGKPARDRINALIRHIANRQHIADAGTWDEYTSWVISVLDAFEALDTLNPADEKIIRAAAAYGNVALLRAADFSCTEDQYTDFSRRVTEKWEYFERKLGVPEGREEPDEEIPNRLPATTDDWGCEIAVIALFVVIDLIFIIFIIIVGDFM